MLLSVVFHLKALERGSLPQYMGAAVRSEFLDWMGISESEEQESGNVKEMHGGSQLRPYTVSDLKGTFHAQKGFNLVESGQSAWFRATTLKKEQSDTLQQTVLPNIKDKVIKFGRVHFQVQRPATAGQHPWARESSYKELADKYFHSSWLPPDSMDMEFASLTTFNSGKDVYMPLPIPKSIFVSWLERWNKFSSTSLEKTVKEIKEARLALSWHEISPFAIKYEEHPWIGFTGKCRFRVLQGDEFWIRLCNMLADYSFYCGTGYKPTYGLGQTKRLDEMDRKDSRS